MCNLESSEEVVQSEVQEEEEEGNKFDDALKKAGSWGPWQVFMVVAISASQIFSAIHSVAAVFLSATLRHRCRLPVDFNDEKMEVLMNNISFPLEPDNCKIFQHDYEAIESLISSSNGELTESDLAEHLSNTTMDCESWTYESEFYKGSAVSEWNLVCSRKLLKATVQATFMAGILIGSAVFGQLSDRIGRRLTMLFCSTSLVIISIGVSFVRSYVVFIAMRFVVALLCAGLMVTQFVLVMEITKPEARTFTGMLNGIPFGLGISVVGAVGYFLRDWRMLQLALGLFCGVLLIYFWILPESPRWLVSKGRYQEALNILKTIAKWNKKVLPDDEEMLRLLKSTAHEKSDQVPCGQQCLSLFNDQATLVRTPIMRRRCLISFFAWFVSAMVYYGIIFLSADLKANPYIMIIVSGLIEVPAFILSALSLYKFGRRIVSCSLFIICSIFILAQIGVPSEYIVVSFVLAQMGKFFNTAVFQLCYLYTSELVPTGVRNIAVGTSSMFARIGSSSAPYIIDVLGDIHYSFPIAVFGGLSLAAGLLTLFLPETLNTILPQTVEDVESKKK